MDKAEQIQFASDAIWVHRNYNPRGFPCLLENGERKRIVDAIQEGKQEVCRVGSRDGRLLVHVQQVR